MVYGICYIYATRSCGLWDILYLCHTFVCFWDMLYLCHKFVCFMEYVIFMPHVRMFYGICYIYATRLYVLWDILYLCHTFVCFMGYIVLLTPNTINMISKHVHVVWLCFVVIRLRHNFLINSYISYYQFSLNSCKLFTHIILSCFADSGVRGKSIYTKSQQNTTRSVLCVCYYFDALRRRQITVMASRITGQSSVCSTVYSDWLQRNINGPLYCPLWGEYTVVTAHKGTTTRKMIPLMTS